jgi:heterodisulfide reductase subunit A2
MSLRWRDYAASLPYVEYVSDNLYSCSQDTQDSMSHDHQAEKPEPRGGRGMHAQNPRAALSGNPHRAGLNKYLFEMANIRNHDSWVHKNNPEMATEKAKNLVRMAISKVALMKPSKRRNSTSIPPPW